MSSLNSNLPGRRARLRGQKPTAQESRPEDYNLEIVAVVSQPHPGGFYQLICATVDVKTGETDTRNFLELELEPQE